MATFPAKSATFDGSNDWLSRGAALTGVSNSPMFTLSCWVRCAANGSNMGIVTLPGTLGGNNGDNPRFQILRNGTNNYFQFNAFNAGGTALLSANTANGTLNIAAGLTHILVSIDLSNTGRRHVYFNGSAQSMTWGTYNTSANIPFGNPDCGVGGWPDGTWAFNGDIGEVWFAPGVYIDFSVQSNRELFIKGGKAVYLGENGELPTGDPPAVYMSGSGNDFGPNFGSGGAFTRSGSLVAGVTIPSTVEAVADPGGFTFTGRPALRKRSAYSGPGAFVLTGYDSIYDITQLLIAETGEFILEGYDAAQKLSAALATGVYSLTGYAAQRIASMGARTGQFVFTGYEAGAAFINHMFADTGQFVLTGYGAAQHQVRRALTGAFNLVGYPAGRGIEFLAATGQFILTGYEAVLARAKGAAGFLQYDRWRKKAPTLYKTRREDPSLSD